jgi:hypothetical protein
MGQVFANAGIAAARVGGNHPAMDVQASRVLGILRSVAARHLRTGQLQGSLHKRDVRGPRGVKDRLVYSTDPNIIAINYGHVQVDNQGNPTGERVPGLRIFEQTIAIARIGS